MEAVYYDSAIVSRCPSPFTSNFMSTSVSSLSQTSSHRIIDRRYLQVSLNLYIRFPGTGNAYITMDIGPLLLTSVISQFEAKTGVGSIFPEIDLPP